MIQIKILKSKLCSNILKLNNIMIWEEYTDNFCFKVILFKQCVSDIKITQQKPFNMCCFIEILLRSHIRCSNWMFFCKISILKSSTIKSTSAVCKNYYIALKNVRKEEPCFLYNITILKVPCNLKMFITWSSIT